MADRKPLKVLPDGGGDSTGLGEFVAADTIGVVDGGTGLASVTANTLLTGNGTSALTSESNLTFDGTRLGVNNTSPSTVDGNTDVIVVGDGNANADVILYSPTSGNGVLGWTDTADTTNQGYIQYIHDSSNAMVFGTAATEGMRLDSAQRLGVGCDSPSTYGAVNSVSDSIVIGDTSSGNGNLTIANSTSGNGRIAFTDTADNTNQAYIRYNHNDNDMDFYSNGGERMRIDSLGGLGIGTATDITGGDGALRAKIVQDGNYIAAFENAASSGGPLGLDVDFSATAPDNNSAWFMRLQDSSAVRGYWYSDGDVWTSDAGTLTSDERLKTNIVDATDKLADVMRLKVRNFKWNTDYHPAKGGEKKLGFIAQELETVFPSLITEHDIALDNKIEEELYKPEDEIPDGKEIGDVKVEAKAHEPKMRKAYKNAFAPILVKALQEVTVRLEAAEAKIAALESA